MTFLEIHLLAVPAAHLQSLCALRTYGAGFNTRSLLGFNLGQPHGPCKGREGQTRTTVYVDDHHLQGGQDLRGVRPLPGGPLSAGVQGRLQVAQTKFIDNTDGGKVQKGSIVASPPLTISEQAEFRSMTGSLQW